MHRSYLFGVCAKHAGGINEEAEDVLSRAMMRAFEKMPAYAAKINSPKAWLTRLTINLCVDMFRESKRRSSKTTNLDELQGADAQPVTSRSDSPEEALLRLEVQTCLNSALEDLPAHVRGPFVLHFTQEVPCEDVGKAFSITAANVRKRIQRARYLLRQKLDPVWVAR
jgi:RNA polymerase sigma-70 factor (ECF subfamily)